MNDYYLDLTQIKHAVDGEKPRIQHKINYENAEQNKQRIRDIQDKRRFDSNNAGIRENK